MIAVLLIVAWLVRLNPFKGGYVAIDLFFVIAGYFMSRGLTARNDESTRDFLTDFVAFQLRRVVPLMTLVLIATSGVALAVYGYRHADFMMAEARSAMLFYSNFHLASLNLSPLDPFQATSPFQQFWSISVLEQVALVWGLLYHFARRANGAKLIRRTLWAVVILGVAFSLLTSGGLNYYATFTRVAGFAIGSLFAVYQDHLPVLPAKSRNALGIVGLGLIIAMSTLLTARSWYPGPYGIVIDLASVAILAACVWGEDTTLSRVLSFKPLAWCGRYSFGLYLWVYPALVVLNYERHLRPTGWDRLAVVAGAIVASVVTHHYVERPVQNWLDPNDDRVDKRMDYLITYRGTGILVVVTVLFSFGLGNMSHYKANTAFKAAPPTALQLSFPTHLDPAFYPTPSQLTTYLTDTVKAGTHKPGNFLPGTSNLAGDGNSSLFTDCQVSGLVTSSGKCTFGDTSGSLIMALVGDERATSILAALQPIFEVEGFKVVLLSRTDCRNNTAYDRLATTGGEKACVTWHRNELQRLADLRPNVVVMASDERDPHGLSVANGTWRAGFDKFARQVAQASGASVYINVDAWPVAVKDPTNCLKHATHMDSCSQSRGATVVASRTSLIADVDATEGIRELSLAPYFCTATTCPAVIGGVATMSTTTTVDQSYLRFITRVINRKITPMLVPFSVPEESGSQSLTP